MAVIGSHADGGEPALATRCSVRPDEPRHDLGDGACLENMENAREATLTVRQAAGMRTVQLSCPEAIPASGA